VQHHKAADRNADQQQAHQQAFGKGGFRLHR